MDDHALQAAIKKRVEALMDAAHPWFERHGIASPDPLVRFDLIGLAAGQAIWRDRAPPVLRFNVALARANGAAFLSQTVPHEVAHIVTAACFGRTRPHGKEWRSIMAFFGQPEAGRCHSFAVIPGDVRRQKRWSYRCGCMTHELTTTRHRRVETGQARYHCRHCGQQLSWLGTEAAQQADSTD